MGKCECWESGGSGKWEVERAEGWEVVVSVVGGV